jgi:hypothetical protein
VTQLTSEQVSEVVKCGRPEPTCRISNGALSITISVVGDPEIAVDQAPVFGGKPLIQCELHTLADHIDAARRGHGDPTRQECYDCSGDGAAGCSVYREAN